MTRVSPDLHERGVDNVASQMPRSALRETATVALVLFSPPLAGLIFTVLPPVLSLIAANFGGGTHGNFLAQLTMTAPSIGLILGGIVAGRLIRLTGLRSVMSVSLIAYAVFGSAGLYVDSAAALVGCRLLLGFVTAGVMTSSATVAGQAFDHDTRAKLLGYGNACGSIVGVLSTLGAGGIAEAWGWRAPFALYLTSFLILVVSLLAAMNGAPTRREDEPPRIGRDLVALWPFYALAICLFIVAIAVVTQVSFVLADDGVVRPSVQSWVIAANSLMSVFGSAVYGATQRRLGTRGMFCAIGILMSAGLIVIGWSHQPGMIAVGCGLSGAGSGMLTPHLLAVILERAPVAARPTAVGLMFTAMFVGDAINPLVMAPLAATFGIHGGLAVVGGALALGSMLFALRRKASIPGLPAP
jgi:MFS family permease